MRTNLITAAQQLCSMLINCLFLRHWKIPFQFPLVPGTVKQEQGESSIDIPRLQVPSIQAASFAVSYKIKEKEIRRGGTFHLML